MSVNLSWVDKDLIAKEKGLHIKFTEQIVDYPNYYSDKIKRLKEIKTFIDLETENLIIEKIKRLEEKKEAVEYELQGRELGFFKRVPHGTTYYIDLNNGDDNNTGLSTDQAWRTIEKYTTLTIRTPGDIAYVRANTSETIAATINFDEDGTPDDMISIIGCDSEIDPWGDVSDVKPIISSGGNNRYVYFLSDDYWYIKNLSLQDSTNETVRFYLAFNNVFDSVDICDTAVGVRNYICSKTLFINCNFYNIDYTEFSMGSSNFTGAKFIGCQFDGPGQRAIDIYEGLADLEFDNCLFGESIAFSIEEFRFYRTIGLIKMRNTKYNSMNWSDSTQNLHIYSEDHQQVLGAGFIQSYYGTITKDTTIKTGGAEFSLKFEPNANCGVNSLLTCERMNLIDSTFAVEGIADFPVTLTIEIRSLGEWVSYPTADELFIEASYFSDALTCERSKIKSTMVLDDETTWKNFSITLTPVRSGIIYVNVYLGKYEASKGCYVNGELVTT